MPPGPFLVNRGSDSFTVEIDHWPSCPSIEMRNPCSSSSKTFSIVPALPPPGHTHRQAFATQQLLPVRRYLLQRGGNGPLAPIDGSSHP
jgi:hypothetical protein